MTEWNIKTINEISNYIELWIQDQGWTYSKYNTTRGGSGWIEIELKPNRILEIYLGLRNINIIRANVYVIGSPRHDITNHEIVKCDIHDPNVFDKFKKLYNKYKHRGE